MLYQFHLENFKVWENTQNIELAPITVFFGSNSSGKSSIGQFLMLLKQSIALSDTQTVLYPGNANTLVDLGLPSDMVYDRDINRRKIKFSYGWNLDKPFQFNNALKKDVTYQCDKVEFEAQIKIQDRTTFEVDYFKYRLFDNDEYKLSIGMQRNEQSNAPKRSYQMTADKYELIRTQGRVWPIPAPIKFYGFPDEAIAYYQNAGFVRQLNVLHTKLFATISYLGPLRVKAQRLYPWMGTIPDDVGDSGQNTINAILAAKGRQFNFKDKGKKKNFDGVIAEMLKEMNLIDDFKIQKIAAERQEYDVKVKTKGAKVWVDIPDVGFGVSQVLPVLVQLFYAQPGSIILMEQPELHLHPNAQAALADVMISAIKARENAKERNIQLIIETHSEHFLRRLQRRIAEVNLDKSLSIDQLRAYFADSTNTPPILNPLEIDLFGNILNWPEGFFGDITGDIYAQANAALRRKINGEK